MSVRPPQKRCTVDKILEQVTDQQREMLSRLLEDGCEVPSTRVAATLRAWGYDIHYLSVQRHRRRHRGGGCTCP